ncbi:MAG: hypothetical protein JRG84_18155 [Deltaproteobacteria bacterium]|nr:hypothetical protein [Deltaproteobacteria bacterium]
MIRPRRLALLSPILATLAVGCATPIGVYPLDQRAIRQILTVDAISAEQPSVTSRQVLLRLGLSDRFRHDPETVLAELHALTIEELTTDQLFALAEYSYLHATALQRACTRAPRVRGARPRRPRKESSKPECSAARRYYVAASMYAYAFAFPEASRPPPGDLDPRLRTAVDIYNLAITSAVRRLHGVVAPRDVSFPLHLGTLELVLDRQGLRYADRHLVDFVPAAQLGVRGLRNRYRRHGVGAPFVARVTHADAVPLSSARIMENVRVPVTIFIRYQNLNRGLRTGELHGRIEVYDESRASEVEVNGRRVPLEYEPTAALAYSLEHSRLWDFELAGYRRGDVLPVDDGLVMLGPYQRGKIPVVLVHGTASSPARWAEMLNEFQSDPILRARYQFWIFMYTTGNPILYSASLLRESLQNVLVEVDPDERDAALRRMVVIGHSQGGLLTKLQVISSGTRFWDNLTDRPFEEVEIHEETREILSKALFFEPLPSVERVVFISTPHRGSFLAGNWMGRIASSLFTAPQELLGAGLDLARAGVDVVGSAVDRTGEAFARSNDGDDAMLQREMERLPSSVDNMNSKNHFIRTLQSIPVDGRVRAHSIIPVRGDAPPEGQNDGVVEYESAHIDEAESELVVYRSSHSTQSHPSTIQETRRILLEHLEGR